MQKRTSWVWPLLGVFVLAWAGVAIGQNSAGGAFVPNTNYIVSGQWTFRTQLSPWIIEGATDDPFETTITFAEPTADRTFTVPNATSGTFLFSSLASNGIDVVNSIWGASNGLVFEGATADAFETTVAPTNVGADITLTLPGLANVSGAVLASTLTTNDVNIANSIWGVSNGLAFGGLTGADGFELTLTAADVGADRTVTIPDMAAASALLATTLTTNAPNVANSIWGVSNGLAFGGLTGADGFEITLSPADVGADRAVTIPDMGAASALLASTLTTNAAEVANSVWGVSNGLRFEGVTADAFETTVSPTNVGAAITLTLPGLANASGAILATTLTTNDVNVANSVWGVSNGLAFGGATGADGFEITLSPADVGADRAITIPDMGAASALLATTLTTNAPNVANSVWGVSNGIAFGGLTGADGFEITLSPADVGADRAVTIPDMGAASALLATTLTTNAPNVANSVWGVSNGIAFGGATGADGFELTLSPADVGADRAVTIPDMGAASALLASTLTTNAPDAANSIWATSNSLVFEGLTANTEELTMTVADVTADLTITWRNDPAGTYHPLTQITGDVTGGFWQIPEFGAADAEITMADNVMYVYRLYLPNWITIANAYARGSVGVDSAADDTLAVAIYEDADAGAQLTEAVSTDFAATADLTLNVADVTLGPGFYRVAVCSQDASGVQFVADTVDDEYIDVANLGAVRIGTAANACVAGDPPATTGALTTADINVPILKFGP